MTGGGEWSLGRRVEFGAAGVLSFGRRVRELADAIPVAISIAESWGAIPVAISMAESWV